MQWYLNKRMWEMSREMKWRRRGGGEGQPERKGKGKGTFFFKKFHDKELEICELEGGLSHYRIPSLLLSFDDHVRDPTVSIRLEDPNYNPCIRRLCSRLLDGCDLFTVKRGCGSVRRGTFVTIFEWGASVSPLCEVRGRGCSDVAAGPHNGLVTVQFSVLGSSLQTFLLASHWIR